MEAKIVRGYKLKLWKERLNLSPSFVDMVDNMGLNYVTLEIPGDEYLQIILITKIKSSHQPLSVLINIPNELVDGLVERMDM